MTFSTPSTVTSLETKGGSMTESEFLALEPRERDKVVGRELFGNEQWWKYTQDIRFAWQVVEKMREWDGCMNPEVEIRSDMGRWTCAIGFEAWAAISGEATADTAPLAICIAALKAKGVIE